MSKGLENQNVATSSISSIIGTTLTYRGYTIEELAKHSTFEEVVYLLWHDVLPNKKQLVDLKIELNKEMILPSGLVDQMKNYPKTAHPMDMLRSALSSLSMYEEDKSTCFENMIKIQAKMATIVAAISRIKKGQDVILPKKELNLAENLLYMINGVLPTKEEGAIMDTALILHADHEFNASTFSSRVTVATLSDLYAGMTSAIGTLSGPLHGGANENVMKMLFEIGSVDNVENYLTHAFLTKSKIMGIGHRVYRDGDPRAFILKKMSKELTEQKGLSHLYEISEKIENKVYREKGLKPNVDFYSASVYTALGIESHLFTPIFAVSRTSGWLAHMKEQHDDNRLIRPRAEYVGKTNETYVSLEERK